MGGEGGPAAGQGGRERGETGRGGGVGGENKYVSLIETTLRWGRAGTLLIAVAV